MPVLTEFVGRETCLCPRKAWLTLAKASHGTVTGRRLLGHPDTEPLFRQPRFVLVLIYRGASWHKVLSTGIDLCRWFKPWLPCCSSFSPAFECGVVTTRLLIPLGLWHNILPMSFFLEQLMCSNKNSVDWFVLGLFPLRLSGFERILVWLTTYQSNLAHPPYNLPVFWFL